MAVNEEAVLAELARLDGEKSDYGMKITLIDAARLPLLRLLDRSSPEIKVAKERKSNRRIAPILMEIFEQYKPEPLSYKALIEKSGFDKRGVENSVGGLRKSGKVFAKVLPSGLLGFYLPEKFEREQYKQASDLMNGAFEHTNI